MNNSDNSTFYGTNNLSISTYFYTIEPLLPNAIALWKGIPGMVIQPCVHSNVVALRLSADALPPKFVEL